MAKNNKDKKKKNVKIRNQSDSDNYIEFLMSLALKALDIVFLRLIRSIKADIAEMYERYQSGDDYVTWTEFNKFNRMNKLLKRIENEAKKEYVEVAKEIKESQEVVYIEKHMTDMYIFEQASQVPMDFELPGKREVEKAIEQPIDKIKLDPTLQKHRENVVDKIRIIITQGVMNGDGYAKVAQAIEKELQMSKQQAMRVARTELGRAQSQAALDSAMEAKKNGLDMKKKWLASLDTRTRHTHQHLDGQSVDIEEPFESSGCKGQAPHLFVGINSARENINCRCTLMFYMDDDELPTVRRGRNVDGSTEVIPFKPYRQWYDEHYKPKEKEINQDKARKELLDLMENGKIKLTINKQSQEKHRPGTNQYKDKVEKMKSTGYQPSIIDVSDTELEDVILSNHGKGDVLVTGKGSFKKTEVLDFGKVIGKSYVDGEYVETKFGKVHYSKTGTHVVPFIYG